MRFWSLAHAAQCSRSDKSMSLVDVHTIQSSASPASVSGKKSQWRACPPVHDDLLSLEPLARVLNRVRAGSGVGVLVHSILT